jgi:arginine deiminase
MKIGFAHNFVTLGPRRVVMAAANPVTQGFLTAQGVECRTVAMRELLRAAGGIGCLTGILRRA